jgi:pectinesterase
MATVPVDVVVAADGSGDYSSVSAAIAAAPLKSNKRHVIHIKKGLYKEFVILGEDAWNVTLIGDGMDATVISGSRCCADGFHTPQTAVLSNRDFSFLCCAFPICLFFALAVVSNRDFPLYLCTQLFSAGAS